MSTHPVEPEPFSPDPEPTDPPNPSHLPVEPELGQPLPRTDPEEPGGGPVAPR